MIDLSHPHDLDSDELETLRSLKSDERLRLAERIREYLTFLTVVRAASGLSTEKAQPTITTKIGEGSSGLDEWMN